MIPKIPVNIQFVGNHQTLPHYATTQSVGLDLIADITHSETVHPGCRVIIPTGIAVQVKEHGWFPLVLPRSGLGSKGIILSNIAGVIDGDYRGEIKLIIWNAGDEVFDVTPYSRLAQLLIVPFGQAEFNVVKELEATERGSNGFGSTGL